MSERHKARQVDGRQPAPVGRRAMPALARDRRLLGSSLLLALFVLLPVPPLLAQPHDRQASPRERAEDRRQRRDELRPERRDEFRDERRRHVEERRERMTPEERRSLRRDLHEAGRDLYGRER